MEERVRERSSRHQTCEDIIQSAHKLIHSLMRRGGVGGKVKKTVKLIPEHI